MFNPLRIKGWRVTRITASGRGLACGLLAVGLALAPASAASPDVSEALLAARITPLHGEAPTAFTLADLHGRAVSLADFRGRAVLLYFWATW